MFCKAKGYALKVEHVSITGIVAGLNAGKYDMANCANKTPEREAVVLFATTPNIKSGNVLVVKNATNTSSSAMFTNKSQLAGKRIGAMTGTLNPEIAKENVPTAKIVQFDNMSDTLIALKTHKIDAICTALPVARSMMLENDDIAYCGEQLTYLDVSPIFPKTEKGKKLCNQYSDFIKPLWEDGTIQQLDAKWFSKDDSKKFVEDYSSLPSPNGTLKMAVDLSIVPFVYMKDGKITGYDIDCAVKFCKAYGYGLEIVPMQFGAIIPALQSGKCDFGASSIAYTKERAENVLFSYPNAKTGNVLLVMKSKQKTLNATYTDISQLNGKRVGVTAGALNDQLVKEKIPDAEIVYFITLGGMATALSAGKIDAFSCGLSAALFMMREDYDFVYLPQQLRNTERRVAFAKTERGKKLSEEYAMFLEGLWENGTMAQLVDKWIDGEDETLRVVEDYSHLPATNGTVTMAVDPSTTPYIYIKDNRVQGYDMELALMFCKAKGYGLKVVRMTHNGLLGSLETGKCDFSNAMDYTEGRNENILFSSVPNAKSSNVVVVNKVKPKVNKPEATPKEAPEQVETNEPEESEEPTFWEDLAASFEKTFIREERWKLFAEGIGNTMMITVLSIMGGILLGFTAFMLCRTGNPIANAITKFSVWLIKGTPYVVLLMILYYVIFGSVNIPGIWVSVIAFTMTFGTSVYRMLMFGTGAVERGQTEAAYALGFTDMQTFFTVILPQAALHFMPSLREEVTMLIKSTSIVGYIAVQDLTKMGDIVRSRTYEAFFPLIAVAVIYFVLAGILNIIVTIIDYRITPSRRKPKDILRGIKTEGVKVDND